MSQGQLLVGGYQLVEDPSAIYKISIHKSIVDFTLKGVPNSFPLMEVNRQQSVKVNRRRSHGIHPFFAMVVWDNLVPPSGYHEVGWLWIPLINSNIRSVIGSGPLPGVYLGRGVYVRKTRPEVII